MVEQTPRTLLLFRVDNMPATGEERKHILASMLISGPKYRPGCFSLARRLQPPVNPPRSRPRRIILTQRPKGVGESVKLAATQELFEYWRRIKGARSAPERNDVEPGAIRGVLADTFILDFDPRAGFPLRIAGSRSNALFMRELRGQPFLDIWRDGDREEMRSIIRSVADEAQPFLIGASGAPPGVFGTDIEILLLPLRHLGATHARILGSCTPRGAPPWLGILPIGPISLISLRALRPEEHRLDRPPSDAGFGRKGEFTRRGHLIVYSTTR